MMQEQEKMSLAIFDPMRATLAELDKKDKSLVFDHTTDEGEKGLRSWVHRLRSYKSDVTKAHKNTKAEALAFGRKVDAIKNELIAGADKIITERMKPLNEIEAKKRAEAEVIIEAERVEKERAEQERLDAIAKREEETIRKEAEVKAATDRLVRDREKLEAEKKAEENAKHREQQARKLAEEKAERDKQEAERVATNRAKVVEQEKAEVIAKAEREKQAAIEAEKEKARKAEAERSAKIEAEKAEKERLVRIERERVKNETHRKTIKDEISAFLFAIIQVDSITTEIVDALDAGSIPNVTINY